MTRDVGHDLHSMPNTAAIGLEYWHPWEWDMKEISLVISYPFSTIQSNMQLEELRASEREKIMVDITFRRIRVRLIRVEYPG
jgi:hypothetical protein